MLCRHYSVRLPQLLGSAGTGVVCSANNAFCSSMTSNANAPQAETVPERSQQPASPMLVVKVENNDERMRRIERMADRLLDERSIREQNRAAGIMHDEEILDGRVVKYNYVGEFCEQRGYGDFHKKMARFMVACALCGAVAFGYVKYDLNKRRRNKMFERQIKAAQERKRIAQQKKLQLAT